MTFEKLRMLICELLCYDRDDITLDTSFVDDLSIDDVDEFQLIMLIEDEFDIEVCNDDVENIVTVQDAVNKINELLGE